MTTGPYGIQIYEHRPWVIERIWEYIEGTDGCYSWHRVRKFISRHESEEEAGGELMCLPSTLFNNYKLRYHLKNEDDPSENIDIIGFADDNEGMLFNDVPKVGQHPEPRGEWKVTFPEGDPE
jgi:hypothetical protein